MIGRTSLLKTVAMALALGLVATAAHAASIIDTAKQTEELSTFSEAITTAGLDQTLAGEVRKILRRKVNGDIGRSTVVLLAYGILH